MNHYYEFMLAGWIVSFCGDKSGDRFIGMIVCLVFSVMWWNS